MYPKNVSIKNKTHNVEAHESPSNGDFNFNSKTSVNEQTNIN